MKVTKPVQRGGNGKAVPKRPANGKRKHKRAPAAPPAPDATPKRGRGRPPFPLDYDEIERMGLIQCTDDEIAILIGMTRDGFIKRKAREPKLLYILEKARENGKKSLRRVQWGSALKGNIAMQIWLGKQHLGQREPVHRQEISGPDGRPIETVDMTDAELLAIIASAKAGGNGHGKT